MMDDHVGSQSNEKNSSECESIVNVVTHVSGMKDNNVIVSDRNQADRFLAAPRVNNSEQQGLILDLKGSVNTHIIQDRVHNLDENVAQLQQSLEAVASLEVSHTTISAQERDAIASITCCKRQSPSLNGIVPPFAPCREGVLQISTCDSSSELLERQESELINRRKYNCNGDSTDCNLFNNSYFICSGAKPKKLKRRLHKDWLAHAISCSKSESESDEDYIGLGHAARSTVETEKMAEWSGPGTDYRDEHSQCRKRSDGLHQICREEDLVDEGAVCDFDRNVFTEEHSIFSEDSNGMLPDCGTFGRSCIPHSQTNKYPLIPCQNQGGSQKCSRQHALRDSGSDDELFTLGAAGAMSNSLRNGLNVCEAIDDIDNGDFIDTDLPALPGQLLSSSADSTSLSSDNADLQHEASVSSYVMPICSAIKNDLSGGLEKEVNHDDGDLGRPRTISSPVHGGFENFVDLSNPDIVCWNSSESENDDDGPPLTDISTAELMAVSGLEAAGVAEALIPAVNQRTMGEQQFGAVGDLAMCFHFDRACCMQDQWLTASCRDHDFLQGQSASRYCTITHMQDDSPPHVEAGGACAPMLLHVNNLSRLHPAMSAVRPGEALANGLDDVAPCNFNDESNHQQKVFEKFPIVEEGRDGACGSGAGQGKNENDNVHYSCPITPAPGVTFNRAVDQAVLTPSFQSVHGIDVQKYLYRNPLTPHQWKTNSGCGVSEAHCMDVSPELCPSQNCFVMRNSLHQASNKDSKEAKRKQIVCHPMDNGLPAVDHVMIWSEYEAYLLQVKQIGMSACGQTAVLNLLKAFELGAEKEDVCSTIQVNLRKEKASVADYLESRAVAGTTAEDLLCGVEHLTKGEIRGRFFATWPPRKVQLLTWLSYWMKQGAVPIATLNLQQGVKQQQIPDAWHHQMVYGVGPRGVYLTNPLEIVSEDTMLQQLTSDSVLLVRRQDVVSRFQPSASLAPLLHQADPRWCTMNVLGQVVNVLREHNMPSVPGYRAQVTSHIRIPAVYRAGITLFVKYNSAEWKSLCSAADFPLLCTPAQLMDMQLSLLNHQQIKIPEG